MIFWNLKSKTSMIRLTGREKSEPMEGVKVDAKNRPTNLSLAETILPEPNAATANRMIWILIPNQSWRMSLPRRSTNLVPANAALVAEAEVAIETGRITLRYRNLRLLPTKLAGWPRM
jgi:hypothetical protein